MGRRSRQGGNPVIAAEKVRFSAGKCPRDVKAGKP